MVRRIRRPSGEAVRQACELLGLVALVAAAFLAGVQVGLVALGLALIVAANAVGHPRLRSPQGQQQKGGR
jgi:hypothetical protein